MVASDGEHIEEPASASTRGGIVVRWGSCGRSSGSSFSSASWFPAAGSSSASRTSPRPPTVASTRRMQARAVSPACARGSAPLRASNDAKKVRSAVARVDAPATSTACRATTVSSTVVSRGPVARSTRGRRRTSRSTASTKGSARSTRASSRTPTCTAKTPHARSTAAEAPTASFVALPARPAPFAVATRRTVDSPSAMARSRLAMARATSRCATALAPDGQRRPKPRETVIVWSQFDVHRSSSGTPVSNGESPR